MNSCNFHFYFISHHFGASLLNSPIHRVNPNEKIQTYYTLTWMYTKQPKILDTENIPYPAMDFIEWGKKSNKKEGLWWRSLRRKRERTKAN